MIAYRQGRFRVMSKWSFDSPKKEYFRVQEDVEAGYMEWSEAFSTLSSAIKAIKKSKALRQQT